MNDSSEVLLGELGVSTKLELGLERLRLLVTTYRLIVDHVGKRGAGAVAGTSILGKLSGAFEDLFRGGGESARRRGIEKKTLEEVLRAHRDNFAIGYDEVVSVSLVQTLTVNRITVLTGEAKYEFSTRAPFESILELFEEGLRDKLAVQRLSPANKKR